MSVIQENVLSNVWFTSDTHFNHKWIIEHRGFDAVEAMNELLIERWNGRVRKGDRVYHLGNLHGHSHGSLEDIPTLKQIDVGVDCHEFAPISFEEVALRMNFKSFVPVDHHGTACTPD